MVSIFRDVIVPRFVATATGLLLFSLLPWAPVLAQGTEDELFFYTRPMPAKRQMLGAALVEDFLYVIGGAVEGEGYTSSVSYASLDANGDVGAWRDTTPLPRNRSYIGNCTFARNRIIYVAGGNVHLENETNPGGFGARDVIFARAGADGQLSRWVRSLPFPGSPVQCNAAVHSDRFLYVIGGADDQNVTHQTIYRAPFTEIGTLGQWSYETAALPIPLWFHCAGIVGNYVFVWGGTPRAGKDRQNRTFASQIQPDGRLGPWTEQSPLPTTLSHASSLSLDPFIISFAGVDAAGEATKSAMFNIVGPRGATQWRQVLVDLPVLRYGAAAHDPKRNLVYLTGGRSGKELGEDLLDTVAAFKVLSKEQGAATTAQVSLAAGAVTPQVSPQQVPQAQQLQWLDVYRGVQTARSTGKPLLVVMGSPNIRLTNEFWNDVILSPGFTSIASRYVLSFVDVSRDPGPALQLGIFRMPAVVIYSPTQNRILATKMGQITLADMQQLPF